MTSLIARLILKSRFHILIAISVVEIASRLGLLKGIVELSPVALVAIIVAAAIILFVWNKLPVAVVAMLVCLSLWASGILSLDQALAGFGDPVVIFIATLFVVSSALEITGVTAWIGKHLIRAAGEENPTRFAVLMMSLVAILAMFVGTTGAVVALLPVVIVIAARLGRKSSQLLMPLAFAAHAGSMLALTGTPVNVLISDAAVDAGAAGFGFFEFALIGFPLLLGSMAIVVFLGEHLLPQRNGAAIPADFSRHARTLVEQYGLGNDIHRLRIRGSSHYVGKAPSTIDITHNAGMQLVAVHEGDTARPISRPHIAEGDHLLLRGDADIVAKFAADTHLSFRERTAGADEVLFTHKSGLAEVAIPPRSGMIGQSVFPGMVTESGDLIVLAIQKAGTSTDEGELRNQAGAVVLGAGDTMLLQGTWKALDTRLSDPDVLTVGSPDLVRRQAAPMGNEARRASVISVAMILVLATGLVPPAVAGLLAAGAIVISGILTAEQSYNAIAWTTVVLVAAMKPLGTAMTETGAAQLAADHLLSIVGQSSPTMLLAGLFLLTSLLGQFISNMATALIAIPIGVAAAAGMGISPRPVLMSIAVAAAAAFLTPIAAPANALVMGPGGYTFGGYWKLGLPLLAWFFVVAVFIVPLIWPF